MNVRVSKKCWEGFSSLLQARLKIKSNVHGLSRICDKCIEWNKTESREVDEDEDEEGDENVDDISGKDDYEEDVESEVEKGEVKKKKLPYHCHCPLYEPSEELVAVVLGGQASRVRKEELLAIGYWLTCK